MDKQLDKILNPKSIAVVGASEREGSVGAAVLNNLINDEYAGKIYPINPKYEELRGLKCYKSILDLPISPDIAVITVPSAAVLGVIEDCHKKQVAGVYIISGGFKEVGGDGAELEEQLTKKLKEYKIRALGPNMIGIVNNKPDLKMNASFIDAKTIYGKTAFITQSGGLGCGLMNYLADLNLGLSYMISFGNGCDVSVNELLEYFGENKDVEQILLYLETVAETAQFKAVCEKVSKIKPVIAIKSGRSSFGAVAAASHTGSLSGSEAVAAAFLKQCGVIREIDLRDLLSASFIFDKVKLPKGGNVVIITNGGGPAILAVDKLADYGITPAKLSVELINKLKEYNSPIASFHNPIDMVGSATPEAYFKTLEELLKSDEADIVLVIHLYLLGHTSETIAQGMQQIIKKYPDKPVLGVFLTGGQNFENILNSSPCFPVYKTPDEAVHAIAQLLAYKNIKNRAVKKLPQVKLNAAALQNIIAGAQKENRNLLTTYESLEFFRQCGLPVCKTLLATTADEAVKCAGQIGYPVVLKASSKVASHKSDFGAVVVNVKNEQEVKTAYSKILSNLKAHNALDGLEGILVQQMVKHTNEFICGLNTDPSYGKVSMFGLGGIYVEVFKDVCLKTLPMSETDLEEQINNLKSSALLKGVRGTVPAKMEQLKNILSVINTIGLTFPIIKEMDINPLVIEDATGQPIIVDARFVIE